MYVPLTKKKVLGDYIYLFIHLLVCLSFHLFFCLSIYLWVDAMVGWLIDWFNLIFKNFPPYV